LAYFSIKWSIENNSGRENEWEVLQKKTEDEIYKINFEGCQSEKGVGMQWPAKRRVE
jgi:hypothetical protein